MVRTLVPVLAPVPEPGLFPIDHDAVTLEPLRVRLVVLLVAGCCLATACNVVQFQQASIVASLRDHGLTSHRFELGDATVRCWSRPGRGTPVVLLHGFGTPALWQWSEQVPALDGRPLVLPDLLWFGGSSSRTRDYTLDHQVRVLAALLDELGLQRVDVVGISYGGLVAVELATAHPELVRRLVIVDSPGREYTRADHAAMLARLGVDHIGRVMIPASDEDVRRMMEVAYAHPPWVPDFVLSQVREHFFPSRRRADLYAVLDALERDPCVPRLGQHADCRQLEPYALVVLHVVRIPLRSVTRTGASQCAPPERAPTRPSHRTTLRRRSTGRASTSATSRSGAVEVPPSTSVLCESPATLNERARSSTTATTAATPGRVWGRTAAQMLEQ